MVFESGGMTLTAVREVLCGRVNDVLVCQDTASPLRPFYTLLVVKDPGVAKKLLAIISTSDKAGDPDYQGCIAIFTQNELLCLLFPYRASRRLSAFAAGQLTTTRKREAMAVDLVMECLAAPYPYPLLYLILKQDNVNLLSDGKTYFTPFVDLETLDEQRGEADCADECAALLLAYLDDENENRRGLKTLVLLRKKLNRSAYQSFPELYKDIRLAMLPEGKRTFFGRLRGWWRRNKRRLFRIFMVLMVILVILAIIVLLSQLIFGDVALFRFFENKFRVIGTEKLG